MFSGVADESEGVNVKAYVSFVRSTHEALFPGGAAHVALVGAGSGNSEFSSAKGEHQQAPLHLPILLFPVPPPNSAHGLPWFRFGFCVG
jgi:hypothetical protein